MSIAHLGTPGESRENWQGERTPPHDLLAEQSALGGMLLSKDAVADVVEILRGNDFYIPKHEVIFDAIMSLYSHGEPTDVITVTDELTKSGELGRAGGAEYLHTLTSLVPTAANAGYYANIVSERALLRRLVEAGTRIVQMGYAGEGEAVDLVNTAQAEIYQVTGSVETEDYSSCAGTPNWAPFHCPSQQIVVVRCRTFTASISTSRPKRWISFQDLNVVAYGAVTPTPTRSSKPSWPWRA